MNLSWLFLFNNFTVTTVNGQLLFIKTFSLCHQVANASISYFAFLQSMVVNEDIFQVS